MPEQLVKIVEWPKKEPAQLAHNFSEPVKLEMMNTEKTPLFINMNMDVLNGRMIPLCIKFCDPICAQSKYRVGIYLLGQPFAEVVVRGITRLFNCGDINIKESMDDMDSTPGGSTVGTPTTDVPR